MRTKRKALEGIEERPSRTPDGAPSYRASVVDANGKRIRRTFDTLTGAQQWRKDATVAIRRGRRPHGDYTATVEEAAAEWKRLAESGVLRRSSGEEYKPASLRAYDQHLRMRVFPELGRDRLTDLKRADWHELVDGLLAGGTKPATIGATIAAVAVLYRYAIRRGHLTVDPTNGLELPAPDNGRQRFASPEEARALLAALPDRDRPVWATAFYTGLRCGELRALRVCDIDLPAGKIDVRYGWDRVEGRIETKGRKRRTVPVPPLALREILEVEVTSGRGGDDLLFGATASSPFVPSSLQRRADKAWKAARRERLTLHDCRHSYASLMIAAGVNAKALSTYMGHASIQITFDRYGHLMPGNEEEAAGLLDAYLTPARVL